MVFLLLHDVLVQVYTIDDRTELEEIIPSAKETCIFYDPAVSFNIELKEKLESLWKKVSQVHKC